MLLRRSSCLNKIFQGLGCLNSTWFTPKRKSFVVYWQRTKFVHDNDWNFIISSNYTNETTRPREEFLTEFNVATCPREGLLYKSIQRLNLEKDSDHTSQSTKPRGRGIFLHKFYVTILRRVAKILNFVWFNLWKSYSRIKWVSEIVKKFASVILSSYLPCIDNWALLKLLLHISSDVFNNDSLA